MIEAWGETVRVGGVRTSLGWLSVAVGERGICMAGFDGAGFASDVEARLLGARVVRDDASVADAADRLGALVDGPGDRFTLPLDARGSAFQERVWAALREVPAGRAVRYGELASSLRMPSAARAVARACSTNPIALAIPCHRVVPAAGGVGGYRWGVERKAALLAREAAAFGGARPQSRAVAQRWRTAESREGR